MAVKALQGISIVPRGNRFQTQNWVNGFAFGGWIYSSDVNIGFGNSPTTISLGVVISNLGEANEPDFSPTPKTFDINKSDLQLGTSNGVESLFDISINGKVFSDFVLYSYEKDYQPDRKLLSVEFKDYSVILDKIYVGLINRQGNRFVHRGTVSGEFSVKCADCSYDGSSFIHDTNLVRDVAFGSYAGLNGRVVDNFAGIVPSLTSPFTPLTPSTTPTSSNNDKFNLNGGYLILGTEDIPQSNCGSLPEVKYSFPELVWSLKARGVNLAGDFPASYDEQKKYYRQNYIGTAREVLQNWCSDFALDFFTSGKVFQAFSIKEPIDISEIAEVLDPQSNVGREFDLDTDNAVADFKESASLDNSFEQSVITYQVKPTESKTESKNIRRHVGYMPMHPVDFNYMTVNVWNFRQNSYGYDFIAEAHLHNFDVCNPSQGNLVITSCGGNYAQFSSATPDRFKRFNRWTSRTFGDLDTSIALSKYNDSMRDIFAGNRIIECLKILDPNRDASYFVSNAVIKEDMDSHFKALGFQPLARILEPSLKNVALTKYKANNGSNSLDSPHYEIYIGYYFPEEHSQIKSWEQECAESMYKYGILTQGVHNQKPYTSSDQFYNLSPTAGLVYGQNGIKRTTYTHTYEPDTKQYPAVQDSPFKNLIPFTGIHPIQRYSGAYIAELSNSWGISKEDFDKQLEFRDMRCQDYVGASVNERLRGLDDTTEQTWDFSFFAPSFHSDFGKDMYSEYEDVFKNLEIVNKLGHDQIAVDRYGYNGITKTACQKLHLCIIPIVVGGCLDTYPCHPNGRFSISVNCGLRTHNPEMYLKYQAELIEEQKRKQKETTPSVCDISIEEELCNKALIDKRNQSITSGANCVYTLNEVVSRYSCEIDPTGIYRVGFHPSYLDPFSLGAYNSRFLDIKVERNPMFLYASKFVPTDAEGNTYIDDLLDPETLTPYEYAQRNARIIYPIDVPLNQPSACVTYENVGKLYYGVMTTDVKEETRSPQSVEIYGEPVNKIGNSSSSIKVINNEINSDLDPMLDARTNTFISYTTLISPSGASSITSIRDYHSTISGLNENSSNKPIDSISFSIIGMPTGASLNFLTPQSGLSNYSVSISENGVKTSLTFNSKPKTPPKQEVILNKITARLPKK
jgi:hypothetical protein